MTNFMCLIVDANAFGSVFNPRATKHESFKPVLTWLLSGHGGGLIFGGSKYKLEVNLRSSKYRPLIQELEKKNRLIEVCSRCVDEIAEELKQAVPDQAFNDQHIVALVIVSRCRVVCTEENEAIPFFKKRSLYPAGSEPPLIYKDKRNKSIVRNAANIVDVCRNKTNMCRRVHA
jgi:hypothetical protein